MEACGRGIGGLNSSQDIVVGVDRDAGNAGLDINRADDGSVIGAEIVFDQPGDRRTGGSSKKGIVRIKGDPFLNRRTDARHVDRVCNEVCECVIRRT